MVEKSEKQIIEEGKKRFRQIMEYMNLGNQLVDEAGDDEESAPAGDDAMGGGAPAGPDGGAPMGGDPMGGGAPAGLDGGAPMGGGTPAGPDGGAPMGDDPMGGGAPQTPQGFDPQESDPAMGGGPMAQGGADGQPGPDDNVVDITDLTDAQDETDEKIDGLNDRFDKVLKALGKFEALITANDEKIENLKAEYEKRNPTQVEKLSMQTAKGYPFNVSPEEFWKEKEASTNYSTDFDDNGKEQGQYTITVNDLNGSTDWKSIANSLDDDDFIFNQTLKGAMGI